MLKKDPKKRPNIKDLLEDPWIQKFNQSNLPELRKKSRDLKESEFKMYSSTVEAVKK